MTLRITDIIEILDFNENVTLSASLHGGIRARHIPEKRYHMERSISSGDRRRREPVTPNLLLK